MKVRNRGGLFRTKLELPIVLLSCTLFFLAGFFGSVLLSQFQDIDEVVPTSRILEESVVEDEKEDKVFESIPNGDSGDSYVTSIPFQVLSWKPRAVYYPGFATAEQCDNIIKKAKESLSPSGLAFRRGETADNTKGVRTSSGTFLSAYSDSTGTLAQIEEKIARATMLPRSHGEAFNVLRYEIGQKYLSHHDSFNPTEYGPQRSQRIASFLLYLSDVEEGGETMFPYENGSNMNIGYDYEKCIGLKVKPRRGDGLLFYSLYPNGTIDQMSLHGSCPVIVGQKWVATKWIRTQ